MTILKVFSGANDQKWQILHCLKYITDRSKHIWDQSEISNDQLVRGYGVSIDPIIANDEILAFHRVFEYPGKRYFYHILLDFTEGSVNPWEATAYGWEISVYLQRWGLQYLQGVHCTKGNGIQHPHVHWLVNALQPLTGMKVHMGFDFIRNFKIFANSVCYKNGIPLIVLGQKSLPFYILNKKDGEF